MKAFEIRALLHHFMPNKMIFHIFSTLNFKLHFFEKFFKRDLIRIQPVNRFTSNNMVNVKYITEIKLKKTSQMRFYWLRKSPILGTTSATPSEIPLQK